MAPKPKALPTAVREKVDVFDHRAKISYGSKGRRKSRGGSNTALIVLIVIIMIIAIVRAVTTSTTKKPTGQAVYASLITFRYNEDEPSGWQLRVTASAVLIVSGVFLIIKSLSKLGDTVSFRMAGAHITLIKGWSQIARILILVVGVIMIILGFAVYTWQPNQTGEILQSVAAYLPT